MTSRLIPLVAAAAVVCAATIAAGTAGAAEAKFQKIPSNGVTLKKRAGYWTECHYSGLGTVCETVYAKAKNGKFRKVPASAGTLKRKAGQVLVCYDGSHNAQVCYWAYSPRKPAP
jgi:hypothetical protein